MNKCIADPNFIIQVSFSNEATFYFSGQNCNLWPRCNLLWYLHYDLLIRNYLNETFPNKRIFRKGVIESFSQLTFLLCGYLMCKVYLTAPKMLEDLKTREFQPIQSDSFEELLKWITFYQVDGFQFEHLFNFLYMFFLNS